MMKHQKLVASFRACLVLPFFCCGLFLSAAGQTDQKEIAAVVQTVSYYLDGGTRGDSLLFSKAFLPDGQMLYMRGDTVTIVSLKEFMARARNNGQAVIRKTRIEDIKVFGQAAQAKLTVEYPTFYFHDLMSLLKTKEGWKIVSKVFYRENKVLDPPSPLN